MKTLILRLFRNKNDQIPFDSYPMDWRDSVIGFAIHNWMEMYPEGKVDFILIWHFLKVLLLY